MFVYAGTLRPYSPHTLGLLDCYVPLIPRAWQIVRDLEILKEWKENAYRDEGAKKETSSDPDSPGLQDLLS